MAADSGASLQILSMVYCVVFIFKHSSFIRIHIIRDTNQLKYIW